MTARTFLFISALGFALSFSTPVSAITLEIFFDSDEQYKQGKKAITQGQLEKAAYYYEEALKDDYQISRKDMIELRSDLCVAYMYMERFEEALVQCKIGLDLLPNRWETLNNLGTVYLLQGDFDNAITIYNKALKMNPKSSVLNKNWEIATQRADAAKNFTPVSDSENNNESPGNQNNNPESKGPTGNY